MERLNQEIEDEKRQKLNEKLQKAERLKQDYSQFLQKKKVRFINNIKDDEVQRKETNVSKFDSMSDEKFKIGGGDRRLKKGDSVQGDHEPNQQTQQTQQNNGKRYKNSSNYNILSGADNSSDSRQAPKQSQQPQQPQQYQPSRQQPQQFQQPQQPQQNQQQGRNPEQYSRQEPNQYTQDQYYQEQMNSNNQNSTNNQNKSNQRPEETIMTEEEYKLMMIDYMASQNAPYNHTREEYMNYVSYMTSQMNPNHDV